MSLHNLSRFCVYTFETEKPILPPLNHYDKLHAGLCHTIRGSSDLAGDIWITTKIDFLQTIETMITPLKSYETLFLANNSAQHMKTSKRFWQTILQHQSLPHCNKTLFQPFTHNQKINDCNMLGSWQILCFLEKIIQSLG